MFDPFYATDGETFRVTRQMMEGLVGIKPGTADIEPELATQWEASEDGKQWTFTLREGVKFWDGEAFNAEAVCYNFERMFDQNEVAAGGPAAYWSDVMLRTQFPEDWIDVISASASALMMSGACSSLIQLY